MAKCTTDTEWILNRNFNKKQDEQFKNKQL